MESLKSLGTFYFLHRQLAQTLMSIAVETEQKRTLFTELTKVGKFRHKSY